VTDADFETAFEQHHATVYRFAWRMLSSDAARDVTQDVFVALLRQPARFDPQRGSMRSFLLGIARNQCLKRLRSDRRWDELDEERFVADPIALFDSETRDIVGAAVRSLPPLQREALILAHYEELPLEDIADLAGATVGTIKSRLHRARGNLRVMLAPLKSHLL